MYKELMKLIEIYKEVNETDLIEPMDWVDFGSSGNPDAYILPLSQLRGRCLCVEGRECGESSEAFKRQNGSCEILKLDCFVAGETGHKFFYETSEGGGSSLYPPSDIFSEILQQRNKNTTLQYLVKTQAAGDLLQQCNIKPVYIKIDIEGAEYEVLESIFKHTNIENPYIVECEINIGSRGTACNGGEILSRMDKHGYRLIDLRKTYLLPDNENMDKLICDEKIYSAGFQGILHQFDGLFIKEKLVTDTSSCKPARIMQSCLVLCLYRQFHLAMNILERGKAGIDVVTYELLAQRVIPSIYNEFRRASNSSISSFWGYHPLFNWLKST